MPSARDLKRDLMLLNILILNELENTSKEHEYRKKKATSVSSKSRQGVESSSVPAIFGSVRCL
jgi:hypothetical protein